MQLRCYRCYRGCWERARLADSNMIPGGSFIFSGCVHSSAHRPGADKEHKRNWLCVFWEVGMFSEFSHWIYVCVLYVSAVVYIYICI